MTGWTPEQIEATIRGALGALSSAVKCGEFWSDALNDRLQNAFSALSALSSPSAARDRTEGHNEPCYYCGEPCYVWTGNPGLWPVAGAHADEPGKVKWHHNKCVFSRADGFSSTARDKALEWQPMDTAPKEGEFLAIREGGEIVVACWEQFASRHGDWVNANTGDDFRNRRLTHWQPLPSPPAPASASSPGASPEQCQHNRLNFGSGDYYIFCLDCFASWMRRGANQEYGELPDGTKIGADADAANHYEVENGIWERQSSASPMAELASVRKVVEVVREDLDRIASCFRLGDLVGDEIRKVEATLTLLSHPADKEKTDNG